MNESLASVLGQIASGLSILTARNENGDETGMLASWVQQAAFNPPSMTVAINQSRPLRSWIDVGSPLAISLISETQKELLGHFGKGFELGAPAFNGLEIDRSPLGLPVLKKSIGWLEGTVKQIVDAGDHAVLLVELTAGGPGGLLGKERPWVHIRKNGSHY